MNKGNQFDLNANWYKLWMQQSKDFFEISEKYLKNLFEHGRFPDPEEHLKQINLWLDMLKKQSNINSHHHAHQAQQTYWQGMTTIYSEAADLLLQEWIRRTREEKPVKSMHELYELWLQCCHEAYQKSLQSKAYQEVYGELMNAALQFWNTAYSK